MSTDSEQSFEERFIVLQNKLMVKGVQSDADVDVLATVMINTARELYDYYGAGEEYTNFLEFVTDVGFEMAEIEDKLDAIEGRSFRDQE